MNPIRSYVLRIYRHRTDRIDGVVQDVNTGRSRPFHSMEELWELLRRPRRRRGARKDAAPPFPPIDPLSTD